MKQNMVETLLGGFVLIVAILFFVYGTGKANVGAGSGGYNVKAQFTDIGGLNVGDDVKILVLLWAPLRMSISTLFYIMPMLHWQLTRVVKLPYDTSARISSEGLLGGTYMALDVGGDPEMLEENDVIAITQSAQNLEQLLGQFIFSLQDTKDEE